MRRGGAFLDTARLPGGQLCQGLQRRLPCPAQDLGHWSEVVTLHGALVVRANGQSPSGAMDTAMTPSVPESRYRDPVAKPVPKSSVPRSRTSLIIISLRHCR